MIDEWKITFYFLNNCYGTKRKILKLNLFNAWIYIIQILRERVNVIYICIY